MSRRHRSSRPLTHVSKRYDRAYFDRWYRHHSTRISSSESLHRKVRLAVSAAEYMLGRRIERVLDVGCGEGRWRAPLLRYRRGIAYTGVDASEYAVAQFGATRNIRRGTLGELAKLKLRRGFDLVVCADMLQYVSDAEVARGLREIRRLLGGVAYIEAWANEDAMEGDMEGWHSRSAAHYRRLFRTAGLTSCGMYCWIDARRLGNVNALEVAE